MKSLFDTGAAAEFKARVLRLQGGTRPEWGTMNVAQAVAHLTAGLELALGDRKPPRMMVGRVFGPIIKPLALRNDEPMRRNSPTVPGLVPSDPRDLDRERSLLLATMDRVVAAGKAGCTTHPHSFFGRLQPDEWGVLMYKHLDHHLRQFGV
jgi:hypothetical protein